jgi:hypothetical protein
MKGTSNTKVTQVAYPLSKDSGNIANEKTKKYYDERQVTEALAHMYGYG